MFILAGYWRAMTSSFSSHMARGLNGRGFAIAGRCFTITVTSHDLYPNVPIADIVEQIRGACAFIWRRFDRRLLICGHSAGGQLAAAMVTTDWSPLSPRAPADLVPAGFAVSGLFDLTPLIGLPINEDAWLDAEAARRLSPLFWSTRCWCALRPDRLDRGNERHLYQTGKQDCPVTG
jgi:arylformamidase